MNRQIKFRAFDDGAIIYSHNNTIVHEYGALGWFFGRIREDAIVMQFTGLTDKNGKEIYEGDICLINESLQKWQIKYFQPYCGFCCETNDEAYPLNDGNTIEVIGNIYENATN